MERGRLEDYIMIMGFYPGVLIHWWERLPRFSMGASDLTLRSL